MYKFKDGTELKFSLKNTSEYKMLKVKYMKSDTKLAEIGFHIKDEYKVKQLFDHLNSKLRYNFNIHALYVINMDGNKVENTTLFTEIYDGNIYAIYYFNNSTKHYIFDKEFEYI